MSKYRKENRGADTIDHEDNSSGGTSGNEDINGVGASGLENCSSAGTSGLVHISDAGTSGSVFSSVADIGCPDDSSRAGTIGSVYSSVADIGCPEDSSRAGTIGSVFSSVADIGCPDDSSSAGTSGSVYSSVADISGPDDSSSAGNSDSATDPTSPMSDTENWFHERKFNDIANKYKYDVSKRGKWIMFFPVDKINEMWAKVCRLYAEGKLVGIQFVRSSTAKEIKPVGGAIRFYCGPYDNEELVKSYGRNVVSFMNYSSGYGFIPFKTDEQTQRGSPAWKNYHHRVEVPRIRRESLDAPLSNAEAEILKPMSVMDKTYIAETIMDIYDRYESDRTLRGRWTLWCRGDTLDHAWWESCTLYRQGKLTGVQSLGTMTGQASPSSGPKDRKLIFFQCGPSSNRDLMMKYGRGIARQLGRYSSEPQLGYKLYIVEEQENPSLPLENNGYIYFLDI